MRLTLKTWISNGDNVRAGSLFGVVDADNPDLLPLAMANGHWEMYRTIDEGEFKGIVTFTRMLCEKCTASPCFTPQQSWHPTCP